MSLSKIQLESIDEALEQMRLYGEVMWISADRSATIVTPAGRYIRDDTLLPSAPPRQDLYPPVSVDDSYVSEVRTRGRSRSNSAQSQNSSNTTLLFGSSRPRSSSSEPVRPLIALSKVRDLQELMDVVPVSEYPCWSVVRDSTNLVPLHADLCTSGSYRRKSSRW